ncbi:DUF6383 domain-containing protein [Prevotella corporis]|uniref:DUF6383 domain-containing protein n=1 Tax=Prevotella corporis TaxID=28128 RepID=UPI0023F1831F|nr:DUF6383 domain-containing protein [Prevotella corporis]
MKTKNLLFAMLLLGSATVVNAQENLLSNPGFEGETKVMDEDRGILHPVGWLCDDMFFNKNNKHFYTVIDEAHSGDKGFYFEFATEGYPAGMSVMQCVNISKTGKDKVYTFSFWYKVLEAKNYKGYPMDWKYGIEMIHDSALVANTPTLTGLGITGQHILIEGETTEGEWKFATVDYDFGDHLSKFTPNADIPEKNALQYLMLGVDVMDGNLLVDDFSLTVKGGTSGIETTTANQPLPVKVDGGELYVGGVKGSRITVYDAIGRTVANTVATSETTHISNLPKNQLLVVKAGNKTAKVMMR